MFSPRGHLTTYIVCCPLAALVVARWHRVDGEDESEKWWVIAMTMVMRREEGNDSLCGL